MRLPDLGDVVRMHDLLNDLTSGQITDDAHRTRGTESRKYDHYQLNLFRARSRRVHILAAHLASNLRGNADGIVSHVTHDHRFDLVSILQTNQQLCSITTGRIVSLHNGRREQVEILLNFLNRLATELPVGVRTIGQGGALWCELLGWVSTERIDQMVPQLVAMARDGDTAAQQGLIPHGLQF